MPGYGYYCTSDNVKTQIESPDDDGLYLVSMESGERELALTLRELSLKEEFYLEGYIHFVTHTQFSMDDRYVAFLHRCINKTDREVRRTRLVILDLQTKEIWISPTSGMVSHFIWTSRNEIIAYCSIGEVDGHYLFEGPEMKSSLRLAGNVLNSDGHQASHPVDPDMYITDTYPDRVRFSKIYLGSIQNADTRVLLDIKNPRKFRTPDFYRNWSCDLHPRWDRKGEYICFDSVHSGERSLCLMRI